MTSRASKGSRGTPGGGASPHPFLGSRGGALFYDLVLDDNAAGEDPFVCLDDHGSFSRILLARIAQDDGATVRQFALKVQRDSYRLPSTDLTNKDVDDTWDREQAALEAAAGNGIVARVPMAQPLSSPPVFYCKRVQRYFHPPCHRTAKPLRVCRDDRLLLHSGLKAYSQTLVRYLTSESVSDGAPRIFYKLRTTPPDENPTDAIRLSQASDLIRDWRDLAVGELDAEVEARATEVFPCRTCSHRKECYPQAAEGRLPAEDRLTPLSFYDFRYLALELMDLRYDELCQLLGGGRWSDVARDACGPGRRGREHILRPLAEHYSREPQWLFRHDPAGGFPLEVLRLKLSAFRDVCQGVLRLHRECDRPHFDITPANVMATVAPAGAAVPSRWCFDVRLVDLGSPRRVRPAQPFHADMPELHAPGPTADRIHRSPLVGTTQPDAMMAHVHVKSRDETGKGVQLDLEADSRGLRRDRYDVGDAALISVGANATTWVWTRLLSVSQRGLLLRAEVDSTHRCASWQPPQSFDANLTVYRNYRAACDLYGLGMLLFRTLLVNDRQDAFAVHEKVEKARKHFDVELERLPRGDSARCREVLLRLLREAGPAFDSAAVLHHQEDRDADVAGIARDLWDDLMVLAFRLTTVVPGFSFAVSHGGEPHPGALMEQITDEVQRLSMRVHVDLFASSMRQHEIRAVCDTMRSELREKLVSRTLEREQAELEPAPKAEDGTDSSMRRPE